MDIMYIVYIVCIIIYIYYSIYILYNIKILYIQMCMYHIEHMSYVHACAKNPQNHSQSSLGKLLSLAHKWRYPLVN